MGDVNFFQCICPICHAPQREREIQRDGHALIEHYCETHGAFWYSLKTEWSASTKHGTTQDPHHA